MSKTFLGVLVLTVCLTAGSAPSWSQDAVKVDRFAVVLWPEYDRPDVLVTFRVELSPEVALPALVDLRIPADVGAPHAVAKLGADGGLYLAQATREVDGEWAVMRITTDRPQIHLEYYAPFNESDSEGAREFTYRWPGGLDITEFYYEVLPPLTATGLTIVPPPAGETMTDLGVAKKVGVLGARSATETETITVRYSNPGGHLSVAPAPPAGVTPPPLASSRDERPAQATPAEPPPPDEPGTSPKNLFVGAVIGAVVAALVGWWLSRRKRSAGD